MATAHPVRFTAIAMACIAATAACGDASESGLFEPERLALLEPVTTPALPGEPALTGEDAQEVPISARLRGELNGIQVDAETIANSAYLTEDYYAPSYDRQPEAEQTLSIQVAADEGRGATMLILTVPRGVEHPLFETGHWSFADDNGATTDITGEGDAAEPSPVQFPVYVSSCSGPAIGNYPDEAAAVDWEMTAEEDPEAPGEWTVVVAAVFPHVNDYGRQRPLEGQLHLSLSEVE